MPQTWLITGSSSGFGRELVEQLLARGDRVAATLRRPEALADLAEAHGDRLWVRALDVTDTARLRAVVDEAFADLGRIDVVVSNAGYGLIGAAEELSDEQLTRQLDTNVVGSLQLARAVLPHLRAQGGGRILQLSSIGGIVGFPGGSLYHASKWAVEGFFEALRTEVAPFGIETCLVEPGSARTRFSRGSLDLAPRLDAYAGTALDHVRQIVATRTDAEIPGDPAKMVAAMIGAADADALPPRLLLGSDAYSLAHAALTARLAFVEAQRDIALATDADDYADTGAGLASIER
ncbi:MAG TPA: SDR family oxidoreductase [Baekduia sp.]|jgi:NAD(P)-dependent dehydrogenase (short-subunit alcohol dehydrogenase family)